MSFIGIVLELPGGGKGSLTQQVAEIFVQFVVVFFLICAKPKGLSTFSWESFGIMIF